MNILSEFEENQFLLANACKTAEEKARLNHAYLHIQREIDSKPIEVCLYDGVEECICSARTYFHISELICSPQDTVIVDCGCNAGLQQVFFNNCYKYIGVDILPNFIKISDNAEFINQRVENYLPSLEFEKGKTYIGISVLCGMCFPNVAKAMYEKFSKVINV